MSWSSTLLLGLWSLGLLIVPSVASESELEKRQNGGTYFNCNQTPIGQGIFYEGAVRSEIRQCISDYRNLSVNLKDCSIPPGQRMNLVLCKSNSEIILERLPNESNQFINNLSCNRVAEGLERILQRCPGECASDNCKLWGQVSNTDQYRGFSVKIQGQNVARYGPPRTTDNWGGFPTSTSDYWNGFPTSTSNYYEGFPTSTSDVWPTWPTSTSVPGDNMGFCNLNRCINAQGTRWCQVTNV